MGARHQHGRDALPPELGLDVEPLDFSYVILITKRNAHAADAANSGVRGEECPWLAVDGSQMLQLTSQRKRKFLLRGRWYAARLDQCRHHVFEHQSARSTLRSGAKGTGYCECARLATIGLIR